MKKIGKLVNTGEGSKLCWLQQSIMTQEWKEKQIPQKYTQKKLKYKFPKIHFLKIVKNSNRVGKPREKWIGFISHQLLLLLCMPTL
jgi:hypothetical protein